MKNGFSIRFSNSSASKVAALTAVALLVITLTAAPASSLAALSSNPSDITQITVQTNNPSYSTTNPVVTIRGQVSPVNSGPTAVVQVFNPKGTIYEFAPVGIADNGSYSVTVKIGGKYGTSGIYRAVTTYNGTQAEALFSFQADNEVYPNSRTVNNLAIGSGEKFVVGNGQTVILTGQSSIKGTLVINLGGKLINHSVLYGGSPAGVIENDGTIKNYRIMNVGGCSPALTNSGMLVNYGKVIETSNSLCAATVTNNMVIYNHGLLTTVWPNNVPMPPTLVNTRNIVNFANGIIADYGTVQNNGAISNHGKLGVLVTHVSPTSLQSGDMINPGVIKNYCGSNYVAMGSYSGNAPISQC